VVVIWAQRWEESGSVAAMPSGGGTSPLEEHAEFLLGLIVEQPDLTLDEIVAAMRKKRIPGSRSAVWRFLRATQRHLLLSDVQVPASALKVRVVLRLKPVVLLMRCHWFSCLEIAAGACAAARRF
jgi:hypothetical protein